MNVVVFLVGLLVTGHAAPVDDNRESETHSASDEEVTNPHPPYSDVNLRLLLAEMKETLANVNKLNPSVHAAEPTPPPQPSTPTVVQDSIQVPNANPTLTATNPGGPQLNLYDNYPVPSNSPKEPPQQQTQEIFLGMPVALQQLPDMPPAGPHSTANSNSLPPPAMPFSFPQPGMALLPVNQLGLPFPLPLPGMTQLSPQQGVLMYMPGINPQESVSYYAVVHPSQGTPSSTQNPVQITNPSSLMPLEPQIPSFVPYLDPAGQLTFGISPPFIFQERDHPIEILVPALSGYQATEGEQPADTPVESQAAVRVNEAADGQKASDPISV